MKHTPSSWNGPTGPEPALLLAAASYPVPEPELARLLSYELDWTRLIQLALSHRIGPAFHALLESADAKLIPTDLLDALQQYSGRLRTQSIAILEEQGRILDQLGEQSVRAVPFKGPLLSERLFGEIGLREPGDIDLLIRYSDLPETRRVLEQRGYEDARRGRDAPGLTEPQRRLYERQQCEYAYARLEDDLVVEPHWALSQRPLAIDIDYLGMIERAQPRRYGDRTIWELTPRDLLVALCIHGGKHAWVRLAWIRDVSAALRTYPEIDLSGLLQEARAGGYERLLLAGIGLAVDCCKARIPDELSAAIARDRTLLAVKREICGALFSLERFEPRNDRVELIRIRLRERIVDRARYVVRTVVAPRRNHLEAVRLPDWMNWGYYVVKLGWDYLVIPAWRVLKWMGLARGSSTARELGLPPQGSRD